MANGLIKSGNGIAIFESLNHWYAYFDPKERKKEKKKERKKKSPVHFAVLTISYMIDSIFPRLYSTDIFPDILLFPGDCSR
jgi:hypothetical protein